MEDEFFEKLRERAMKYYEEESGHGFEHIQRVYDMAINLSDGENVDMDVIKASTLLHDIARSIDKREKAVDENGYKLCHAKEGAKMAVEILKEMNFDKDKINNVSHCIAVHRYSAGLKPETREAEILQDADRLDALGAVIIVRMIKASMTNGEPIYDPNVPLMEEYDGTKTNVINHIYEKILKIEPESFKTKKAREVAKGRYKFVKDFAERYIKEVEGKW